MKSSFLSSSILSPFASLALVFGTLTMLVGCNVNEQTNEPNNHNHIPPTEADVTVVRPQTSIMRERAAQMQEQQKRDYATYAAKTNFMCPKLLTRKVDDARIRRRNEVMKNNYCEYYIYPKQGQSIEVVSNDDRIERILVAPTIYNFANGAYIAKNKNRHTIRLNYNGASRKPADFRYDIEIIVK